MNKSILVIDTSVIIKWLSSENEQNLDQADATLITENIKHQGKSTDVKVISLKDY